MQYKCPIPQFVLIALIALAQGTYAQETSSSVISAEQCNSSTQQHSILERTDVDKPSETIRHIAKLPRTSTPSSSIRTSLTSSPVQQSSLPVQELAQPIELQIIGAELFESGQLQTFTIRIKNNAAYQSAPAEVRLGVPPGYRFQDSSIKARFDARRNVAAWQLAELKPNQEVEVQFRSVAIGQGPQLFQVSLLRDQTIRSIQQLETFITNTASTNATTIKQARSQNLPPIVESEPVPQKRKNF